MVACERKFYQSQHELKREDQPKDEGRQRRLSIDFLRRFSLLLENYLETLPLARE